jgi:hypothetical protein
MISAGLGRRRWPRGWLRLTGGNAWLVTQNDGHVAPLSAGSFLIWLSSLTRSRIGVIEDSFSPVWLHVG